MSGKSRQNAHCSDETLIRYLDLELPPAERDRVQAHLGACWQCRASLAELDRAIHKVASLARQDRFPGPERVALARQSFLDSVQPQSIQAVQPVRPQRTVSKKKWMWLWAGAAAAVVTIAVIPRSPKIAPVAVPIPASVLTEKVRAAEAVATPAQATLVQTFRFAARELQPPRRRSEASIEIWSDAGRKQTGVRWMDSRARLVAASLRTAPGGPVAQPLGWALAARQVGWDGLTDGFSAELQARNGPLLLVSEFLQFCAYAKVQPVVEAERPNLILSATYRSGERRMKFWIEADSDSLQPLRQGIVLSDARQGYELVLEPRGRATARRIDPARFVIPKPPARAAEMEAPPEPVLPEIALVPPVTAEEIEVDVRYALQRAHQSSGAIVVGPALGGRIVVKGVAASAGHRDQLEAALALAGVRDRVEWLVQVAPPDPARPPDPGRPERAISRALHAEVWDLAQLAERYDAACVARLNARSRRLLATIVAEKSSAVAAEAARLRAALGEPAAPGGAASEPGHDWRAQVFAVYRHAAALDNLVETQSGKALVLRLLDAIEQAVRNVAVEE